MKPFGRCIVYPACLALAAVLTTSIGWVQAAPMDAASMLSFNSAITADLSEVPTFSPVAVSRPYTKTWQVRLLAFHVNFLASREATPTQVGQIEGKAASD